MVIVGGRWTTPVEQLGASEEWGGRGRERGGEGEREGGREREGGGEERVGGREREGREREEIERKDVDLLTYLNSFIYMYNQEMSIKYMHLRE